MFRLLAFVIALVFLVPASQASAQNVNATWVRGYPERVTSGCVWYVAQWSDGAYSASPWQCDPGSVARLTSGATATSGYPQRAANGCIEYVTQWSDRSYTWVPVSCPAGVSYFRYQADDVVFGGAPTPPTTFPTAPPVAPPAGGGPGVPPATRNTCPSGYPIKGNASSGIFHVPGQRYYNATNPERCFATEADARAAGYRRSLV